MTAPFWPILQQSSETIERLTPPVDRTSGVPENVSPARAPSETEELHLRLPGFSRQTLIVPPLLEIEASTSSPLGNTAPDPLWPAPPTLNCANSGCGSPTVPLAACATPPARAVLSGHGQDCGCREPRESSRPSTARCGRARCGAAGPSHANCHRHYLPQFIRIPHAIFYAEMH